MNKTQKKNHVAKLNPWHSVVQVMDELIQDEDLVLVGVKNVKQIPREFVEQLEDTKRYKHHTLDEYAFGGRAIDLHMHNPISGNFMTGSSSGTAVNVFLNINDIGIGVDGGGSVLAPAMSLNLFGFISPLLAKEHMKRYSKTSTDGIVFTPSLGFISRDYKLLEQTIKVFLPYEAENKADVVISDTDTTQYPWDVTKTVFPDIYGDRETLIPFVKNLLATCDFMVSYEGPVDLNGFGDTVFGHFDEETKQIQRNAKKGLIRVANMSGASAITIPDTRLGYAYVLLCESKENKISTMLSYAKMLITKEDKLTKDYFTNHDLYFNEGYLD